MANVATRSPAEGLEWVRKELSSTFNDARSQLQKFADQPSDRLALEKVSSLLHTAHGALRMVEVYGAALLVEEMVALSRKLTEGDASTDDGLEVLSRAIVQLPSYLDRVAGGGHDVPLVLLPLLNDLRAVRGSPLLSESSLFVLNIDQGAATPERAKPDASLDYRVVAKKLRPHYQKALLGWLRGEDPRNNLTRLGGVAAKLEAAAASSPVYQFWWILGGVVEAVQENGLLASAAVKRLLGQADGVLKKLVIQGEQPFVKEPPRNLVNNLLYYVARAESDGKRVTAIKNSFSLSELLEPDGHGSAEDKASLQGPSVELMKTVGAAIKQDVGNVKDAIDVFVRTQSTNHDELTPQRDSMKKLGDTLGMLGLENLRQQVTFETDRLSQFIDQSSDGDDDLLEIAATLINVENAIDGQLLGVILPDESTGDDAPVSASDVAAAADRQNVTGAVLRECVVNLTRIKEMLSQFVDNPQNGSVLDSIPKLIVGIRAGLSMLEKERASDLLSRVEWHIAAVTGEQDLGQHTHELDRLADAIVSIEYYMETIRAGRSDPWYMLDNAERCLESIQRRPDEDSASTPQTPSDTAVAPVQPPQPVIERGRSPTATSGDVFEATDVREASQFNASNDAARRAQALEKPLAGISGRRVDPELLELFIEEAKEEVATLRRAIPRWKQDVSNREVMLTIRRSFHTLKGSGRMVGAMLIGEYAWSFENLVNKVVGHDFEATPEVVETLAQSVEGLPALIEQLEVGTPTPATLNQLMEKAWQLIEVRAEAVAEPTPDLDPPASVADDALQSVHSGLSKRVALENVDVPPVHEDVPDAESVDAEPLVDHEPINDEKIAAAQDVLGGLEEVLDDLSEPTAPDAAGLALVGAAATSAVVGIDPHDQSTTDVVSDDDSVIETTDLGDANSDEGEATVSTPALTLEDEDDVTDTDATSITAIVPGVVLEEQPPDLSGDQLTTQWAPSSSADIAGEDDRVDSQTVPEEPTPATLSLEPALHDIFLKESLGHLDDVRRFILDVSQQAEPFAVTDELHRAWHTLSGSANTANVGPLAEIATPMNQHLRTARAESWPLNHEAVAIIGRAADQFEYLVRGINTLTDLPEQSWLLADINSLPALGESAAAAAEALEGTGEIALPSEDHFGPGYDSEIAAIFAEEAVEILDGVEQSLGGWFARDDSSSQRLEELLRHLHTLKGGARMAGITGMGDLSHETESLVEHLRDSGQSVTAAHERVIRNSVDTLHGMTDKLHRGRRVEDVPELLNTLRAMTNDDAVESHQDGEAAAAPLSAQTITPEQSEPHSADSDDVTLLSEEPPVSSKPSALIGDEHVVSADPLFEEPASSDIEVDTGQAVQGLASASAEEHKTQDKARIDARLLDDMLNNAGEVSIFHSRLEEQIGSISFNLTEHQQTVMRLREQLRKLEIETEAQIMHRHQDQASRDEEFDPLELDRYSGLQQLSRALAESVSDLASLQDLMTDIARESESLLVQQARVTGELQDALIRSRMLPFSQFVSRFERVVRQAASEQHKQAALTVTGASGELDRQVLQRMLPPFEHMLRNAVIHGIESVNDRLSAGKPAQGSITLDLAREGAEMVIRVIDDGRGLDADRLVAKARKLGIIDQTKTLEERAAYDLIFAHGFSTASSVTQSAGRGVGMDVVASEVKDLGGSVQVDSEFGVQTVMTIRLPLTLAVSQALLVRCGAERFAIPLPAVHGVVRAARDDVLNCLEADIDYNHEGIDYSVRKLAPYLGAAELGNESLEGASIPLILIRSADQSCAFLVDELLGSSEVVVKSAGPMISSIQGVAGATILGDGSIVVILDVASLIRNQTFEREGGDFVVAESSEDLRPVVLVVDDSITVRRVTERLLERNSMRVLLAKDGVDAVAVMQEQVPDCILLDIEMPRMDGYEVASHVRNTDELQHVPICMITSRVGEKHRARAFELGVDKYLGKPYQENQLLDVIQPLLARAMQQRK